MRVLGWSILGIILLLCACHPPHEPPPSSLNCRDCHELTLDEKHNLPCTRCHRGKEPATSKEDAHQGLLAAPAAPAVMEKTCGECHPQKIKELSRSPHLTLAGEINTVLAAFGLPPVSSPLSLKEPAEIHTLEELVHDLLRRRCLRCHLYYEGDTYAETRHGLGCAACHLPFGEGGMLSHTFLATPPDRNCLHCHYGNRVGFDYYGMFEHDYPYAFRSPLIGGELPPRPWGVEFHEMQPDVHLKAGMPCLACHRGPELMAGKGSPRCTDCHQGLKGPFHTASVLRKARCSACHATWAFQDRELHLLLHYDPDWEDWSEFYVQGSSEVEEAVITFFQTGEAKALMRDKFSGRTRAGIWFLGFKARRFENLPLGYDREGRVSVMRPLLTLHLSLVTEEEEVPFDDVQPALVVKDPGAGYLPYSPHTIGAADYFRTQKVLIHERSRSESQRP